MEQFLTTTINEKNHNVKKTVTRKPTHTSMRDNFRGSFHISRKHEDSFFDLYCDTVSSTDYGITETYGSYDMLTIDFDRKEVITSIGPNQTLITDEDIARVVGDAQRLLTPDGSKKDCAVMTKHAYITPPNNKGVVYLKHGFHLQFINLFCSVEARKDFQQRLKKIHPEVDITYKNPWLLYGAVKNDYSGKYTVRDIITHSGETVNPLDYFDTYTIYDTDGDCIDTTGNIEYFYPRIFSVKIGNRAETLGSIVRAPAAEKSGVMSAINMSNYLMERGLCKKHEGDTVEVQLGDGEREGEREREGEDTEGVCVEDLNLEGEIDDVLEKWLETHPGLSRGTWKDNTMYLTRVSSGACPLDDTRTHNRRPATVYIHKGVLYCGCTNSDCRTKNGKRGLFVEKITGVDPVVVDPPFESQRFIKRKTGMNILFDIDYPSIDSEETYVDPDNYCGTTKAIVVKAGLGRGKSTSVAKYLNDNDYQSVLVITPRISYATNIHGALNEKTKHKFELYRDVRGPLKQPYLVVQAESFHRIDREYDLILMDECESILTQFTSHATHGKNHVTNIDTFLGLLKASKKIICADAFVSNRTLNFLKCEGIPFTLHTYTKPLQKRTCTEIPKLANFLSALIDTLQQGKKVYMYCSSKNKLLTEILPSVLKYIPDTKILALIGGSKASKNISNVNEEWVKYDLVATTSVVTVGIDFTEKHFDSVFIYCNSMSRNNVRDIFQSSYRPRILNDLRLVYHLDSRIFGKLSPIKPREVWEGLDREIALDGSFMRERSVAIPESLRYVLFHTILERNMSFMQTEELFDRYLTECNYEKNPAVDEIDELELATELIDMEYEDIPVISNEELEELFKKEKRDGLTLEERGGLERRVFDSWVDTKGAGRDVTLSMWGLYINYGKGKFSKLRLEKAVRLRRTECLNRIQEYRSFCGMSSKKYQKLGYILELTDRLDVEHSCDVTTIPRGRLEGLTDWVKEKRVDIQSVFGLRDQRKNTSVEDVRSVTALVSSILESWGYNTLKSGKRTRTRVNGKQVTSTDYMITPAVNNTLLVYTYLTPLPFRVTKEAAELVEE